MSQSPTKRPQTEQTTLNGETVDDETPSSKQTQVLHYADPDTDLERVARWWVRARQEGCYE